MPNAETNAYRLNTRSVFLTYPQCDIPMRDMLEELTNIRPYANYCICQERHEDGNLHLHALLRYDSPVNTRNERYFDVRGHHPNVQSARDIKAVLKYIRKDGNYEENWPTKRNYGEILSECKDYTSFMDAMKDNQPKDYILHQDKLEYFAEKFYKRPPSPYDQIPEARPWNLPDDLNNWLSGEFIKTGIIYNYENQIDPSPCGSVEQAEAVKLLGQDLWDAISTGEECQTSKSGTTTPVTSSLMISNGNIFPKKRAYSVRNVSLRSLTSIKKRKGLNGGNPVFTCSTKMTAPCLSCMEMNSIGTWKIPSIFN